MCYPYSFQPVNLIVEQHLSIGQVDVTVVGIVQQMSEQSKIVPGMLSSLFGCALKTNKLKLELQLGVRHST